MSKMLGMWVSGRVLAQYAQGLGPNPQHRRKNWRRMEEWGVGMQRERSLEFTRSKGEPRQAGSEDASHQLGLHIWNLLPSLKSHEAKNHNSEHLG